MIGLNMPRFEALVQLAIDTFAMFATDSIPTKMKGIMHCLL